jgi:hypothetical protein
MSHDIQSLHKMTHFHEPPFHVIIHRLPHQWITEFQIFMQIVQAVEKVSHVSAQDREDAIVSILADEVYEVNSHLIHEFHL